FRRSTSGRGRDARRSGPGSICPPARVPSRWRRARAAGQERGPAAGPVVSCLEESASNVIALLEPLIEALDGGEPGVEPPDQEATSADHLLAGRGLQKAADLRSEQLADRGLIGPGQAIRPREF